MPDALPQFSISFHFSTRHALSESFGVSRYSFIIQISIYSKCTFATISVEKSFCTLQILKLITLLTKMFKLLQYLTG